MNQESAATQHPAVDAALKPDAIEGEVLDGLEEPTVIEGETEDAAAAAQAAQNDAAADAQPKEPAYVEALRTQLAQTEQALTDKDLRLQATLVQYKEALADFDAAKARLRRDVAKDVEAGKRAILADLLDVVDNLERAIEAGKGEGSNLLSGVTMVRDQFLLKLQVLGVKRQEALGKPFDPARFEAVSMVPVTDAAQDGCVVGVIRDCYTLGTETLRYGMVAVGKAPEAPQAAADAVDATDSSKTE